MDVSVLLRHVNGTFELEICPNVIYLAKTTPVTKRKKWIEAHVPTQLGLHLKNHRLSLWDFRFYGIEIRGGK